MVTIGNTIKRGEDLVQAEVEGEIVMMSISKGHYFGLDDIGSRIWQLIEEPQPVEELCKALRREYDVEAKTCEEDVLYLLNKMHEKELIQLV